jgi:hypothetical protein
MYATKRSGFAMIMAIFVVVLIALGGVVLLSGVSVGQKTVSGNYFKAQAQLLSESATEFAVMQAQNQNCLTNLAIAVNDPGGNPTYDIDVRMRYSFGGVANAACGVTPNANVIAENTGKASMIWVETTVQTHDDTNLTTERIRVTKQTWQPL